jgi:hypothetical protein
VTRETKIDIFPSNLPFQKKKKKITHMPFSHIFIFSTLLALGFLVLMAVAAPPECGFLFDGSTPLVDIDKQSDVNSLRANWYGFYGVVRSSTTGSTGTTGGTTGFPQPLPGPSSSSTGSTGSTGTTGRGNALTFEVAVISEAVASESSSGFKAINRTSPNAPDNQRCRSFPGFKRADIQGFKSVSTTPQQGPLGFPVDVWKSDKLNLTKGVRYFVVLKVSGNGRTLYTNTDGIVVGVSTGSEDDDQFPPYKAGLIAMGIAICCLLVLLLLLILVAKGKGEDKYTTTVHRNENVDKL